jgi:hypothetical protein
MSAVVVWCVMYLLTVACASSFGFRSQFCGVGVRATCPHGNIQDVQDDQKVSVRLTITVQSSGAQRLFDHPV